MLKLFDSLTVIAVPLANVRGGGVPEEFLESD